MDNVKSTVNGNILTIEVDLSKRLGRSASGKTIIVATTAGNQKVEGFPDIQYGLNVYTK